MFISKKNYNEMKQYYENMENKYINECAMLKSSVSSLREGIIHAMIYLNRSDNPDVDIARTQLRTAYISTLDKRDNNREFAIKMMPEEWKEFLRQYKEHEKEFMRA